MGTSRAACPAPDFRQILAIARERRQPDLQLRTRGSDQHLYKRQHHCVQQQHEFRFHSSSPLLVFDAITQLETPHRILTPWSSIYARSIASKSVSPAKPRARARAVSKRVAQVETMRSITGSGAKLTRD